MYKDKVVLCVIPARSGSKGLPGKNIIKFVGKPLIAHSIEQARGSKYIDRVIVSTDSKRIADISERYGAEVPFIRPKRLAKDHVGTIDVLLHAADFLKRTEGYIFDIIILLHANAPLRSAEDVDSCIELLVKERAESVFSVTEAHRNPYFNMVEVDASGKVRLVKKGCFATRQSAPKVFDMNSSIYVWNKSALMNKKKVILENSRIYIMPKVRSVDIDDITDLRIAECLRR